MTSVSVVIVDDHGLVREGLRLLLELEQDIVVVGEAGTPQEAFEIVERTDPTIALVDLTLGDSEGIALIRGLGVRYPTTRTVALTMHRDGETVREALLAGASGYLVKGASRGELVAAIHAVARGERYLHSSIAGIVVGDSLQWLRHGQRLSPREREVLRLVAGGRTAADVGRVLGISAHTVRRHVSNLTTKLGVGGRAGLTRYAVEHGLVRSAG
ncbi:MAG: response regulator transcription factor [Chloroflexota bacterium]